MLFSWHFICILTCIIYTKSTYVTTDKNSKNVLKDNITTDKRAPVKLTTKQGFILNQLIGTYVLENPFDQLCKNHSKEFKTALRAFEPWALKMLDSSSKLQSGLLLGNLVEYGSYQQCLRIYAESEFGPIFGKHCLLKILPSIDLVMSVLKINNMEKKKKFIQKEMFELGWSVCIPHSCPVDDVVRHFNKSIMEIFSGVELEVTLNENYCHTNLDYPKMGVTQYSALAFYCCFILLAIIASTLKTAKTDHFINTFSISNNANRLCKLTSAGEFDFLYGLRILSSSAIVIGHRFVMFIIFPVINGIDELEWPSNFSSMIILGSTVCVDSFFVVSGMLVSIGFFQSVKLSGSFNVLGFYLHRYLRITLPMAMVVLFYVTLAQFFADGPYSYDVYLVHQKPCQDYWWSALLHLQTIINPGQLCLFPIWYLSCEILFNFLSPLILYPLWKCPRAGWVSLIGAYVIFMGLSFFLAWKNEYDGTPLPVTNQILFLDYFKNYYVAPHVRAPPYLLGLAFGWLIFKTKSYKIKLNPPIRLTGWLVSAICMTLSAGGCHTFYSEYHEYNRLESSSYLAFARSGWSLGLMWMIFCCVNGFGGILNTFLSAYIFKVLGKVTYGVFLLHSIIQVYKGASSKVSSNFTNFNAVYDGLADLSMSVILGFVFTIFFEMPLLNLQARFFRATSRKTTNQLN